MGKLENPPKFGNKDNAPGPRSLIDWVQFWRWLTSLWKVADASIDFPEAKTILPPPTRSASIDDAIGAAIVFGAKPQPSPREDLTALLLQRHERLQNNEELRGLVEIALSRQFPPPRAIAPQTAVLIGTHADRLATPAGTYPDGTLFYETDREVFYIDDSSTWIYSAGYMRDVVANQPG